ncbi:uncharacterized protein C5orf52 homolog [Pyxicephalus adspersus]|uniref:Uncharacterized protein n=1 Tax=Pyxicephalus adspersus TaxID=30357 RepID=A0AAV3AKI6_PYXAD|nr:TPA: hypothetical protein GDO54_014216 [Pyxicephalus adspersus]DBA23288.1 TPA: hypothetical protein GDO54_014216 [Pyxicephalus adspersus]
MANKPEDGPEVSFCKTKGTDDLILYSLLSGAERHTKSLMPTSHLTSVIMHDNACEERMLELKVRQIERMKVRSFHFHEHLKNIFLNGLHKRSTSWEKEHETFIKHLQRKNKRSTSSDSTIPIISAAQEVTLSLITGNTTAS